MVGVIGCEAERSNGKSEAALDPQTAQELKKFWEQWDSRIFGDQRLAYKDILKAALSTNSFTLGQIKARFPRLEQPQPGLAAEIWLEIESDVKHAQQQMSLRQNHVG